MTLKRKRRQSYRARAVLRGNDVVSVDVADVSEPRARVSCNKLSNWLPVVNNRRRCSWCERSFHQRIGVILTYSSRPGPARRRRATLAAVRAVLRPRPPLLLLYHAGLLPLTSYKFLMPYSPAAVLRRAGSVSSVRDCSRCLASNNSWPACPPTIHWRYSGGGVRLRCLVRRHDWQRITSHALLLHCFALRCVAVDKLLTFTSFTSKRSSLNSFKLTYCKLK